MANDLLTTILSAVLVLFSTILALYVYYHYFYQKIANAELNERSFILFTHAFISQVIIDKLIASYLSLNTNVSNNNTANEPQEEVQDSPSEEVTKKNNVTVNETSNDIEVIPEADSEADYIQSYRIDENDNSKIYYRSSKNYGEDEYYNVRTWFGVNDEKLNKEEYDYICFNIKGVEKIYFKIEDFTKLIETYITLDEQKKYSKRKSYDTYIQRSKNDNNYYIKRLGSHLNKPILVK